MIPNLWLYCNHPNLMREITPPPEFYSTQESKLTPAYTLHFGHWIMDPMVHTSWAYGSNGQRWFWMNRYAITWFSFKLNRKKWLYMCLKVEWMNSYSLLDNVLQKSGVFFFPKSKMSLTRIIPFLHPSFSWWAIASTSMDMVEWLVDGWVSINPLEILLHVHGDIDRGMWLIHSTQ